MEISISNQLITVIYSIILGIILGAIYQIFDILGVLVERNYSYKFKEKMKDKKFTPIINPILKKESRKTLKNIVLAIIDFSYFIVITPVFVVFIYENNNGVVRWYIFLFSLIGFVIFKATVGKILKIITEYISFYLEVLSFYIIYYIKKKLKMIIKKKKTKKEKKAPKSNQVIISYGR